MNWYPIPVFNSFQIISLWNSKFSLACDILRNCYEAFALYAFGRYLVACLGTTALLYIICIYISISLGPIVEIIIVIFFTFRSSHCSLVMINYISCCQLCHSSEFAVALCFRWRTASVQVAWEQKKGRANWAVARRSGQGTSSKPKQSAQFLLWP